MVESDTIKLLRECDAGIQMGAASIDEVQAHVQDADFRETLDDCKAEHEKLRDEVQQHLAAYQDEGKAPDPMAKGMSWMKTNVMLMMNDSDATIADLMTDGCNMGVKSLNKYLNQYEAAEEYAKDVAKRLINLEQQLAVDIRAYL